MDSLSDLKWSLKSPNSFSSAVHLTFKNSAVLIKLPWSSAVIYKRKVCVTFWWNASSRLHETSLHRNDIAVSCVILKLNRGTCNILRDTWENQIIPVHFYYLSRSTTSFLFVSQISAIGSTCSQSPINYNQTFFLSPSSKAY